MPRSTTLLIVVGLLGATACSDPVRETASETSPGETGDALNDTPIETGDSAVDSGGGDADADATPIGPGTTQIATVPGGVRATSAKYILLTTTGQSPGANGVLQSSKYTLTGGIVSLSKP